MAEKSTVKNPAWANMLVVLDQKMKRCPAALSNKTNRKF